MYYLNLKAAFRHLKTYKVYSIINIIGLTLGMSSALMILLWVQNEINKDQFLSEDLYILRSMTDYSDRKSSETISSLSLAPVLESAIPEVLSAIRMTGKSDFLVSIDNQHFFENAHYVDENFFEAFNYPLKGGNSETVLSGPNSIVISQSLAEKYFGSNEALGREIHIKGDNEGIFTVTGVFYDISDSSTFQFDLLLPIKNYIEVYPSRLTWASAFVQTFILTKPGTSDQVLNQKINEIYRQNISWESITAYFLQPVKKMNLYGDFGESMHNPTGLIKYISIFSIAAFLVLFLACMNYTNLATAIASRRIKEVGIKKAAGAMRRQVFVQFATEAWILTFVAFILSIIIVSSILPDFNRWINLVLKFNANNIKFIFFLLLIPFATGIITAFIPSLYLSSFSPTYIFKSIKTPGKGMPQLRKTLVIAQFAITIAFILSSIVLYRQVQFMLNKDLGLDKENIIWINQTQSIANSRESFKQELEKQPGIKWVTYAGASPLKIINQTSGVHWRTKDPSSNILFSYLSVESDFCRTFGIEVINGRDFQYDNNTDRNSVLINETLASTMGFDNPVGEVIDFWFSKVTIVGVVRDFHITSLHRPINNLVLLNNPDDTKSAMIKFDGKYRHHAIKNIESVYKNFDKQAPFDFKFIDEQYANNYNTEIRMGRLSILVTILIIIISGMGLFGLALFISEQRTKEIGIRKTMGAKTSGIMYLLTSSFLRWVTLSYIIGCSTAYFFLNNWLQSFAYSIHIGWGIFAVTGLITGILITMTIGWQAYYAANRNPIISLRYE